MSILYSQARRGPHFRYKGANATELSGAYLRADQTGNLRFVYGTTLTFWTLLLFAGLAALTDFAGLFHSRITG